MISIAGISGANIWIKQKVPNLMPELKLRESLFEHLFSLITLGIPMLDIQLGAQWQCHETLQLACEEIGSFPRASDVMKGLLLLFSTHGNA